MDLQDLIDLEEIRRLKYKYQRCVDTHDWDELATCFAEDAVSSYSDGRYSYEGRDNIMAFLSAGLGPTLSLHTAHHGEIDLTSRTTAKATWALEDTVFHPGDGTVLHGAGYYHDTYKKVDGEWKIASIGYERSFENVEKYTDVWKSRAE